MIELENISKHYENKVILDNLNVKFDKGLIYHLNGVNGVGKTTFLNILYNITTPTSGRYLFKKIPISSRNQNIKNNIGFFHTNAKYLINDFTVGEYIDFYINIKFPKADERLSKKIMLNGILEGLNFIEHRDILINKLSTGTKMKVSIACVLIGNFDLILLDEPFANLDQDTCKKLLSIITEINRYKETTFIISSHTDLLDDNYYDRKLLLRDKKIN